LNLEALINQYYKNLNSNDMIVLNYVMQHKKECTNMNISRLSSECSISTASIVRTMKKLGFSGYSEFKFLLKGQNPGNMPTEGSNLIELLEKDIQATMKLMKQVDLNPILTLLYNAKRIYGFGIGFRQQNALQDFAHNMVSCDKSIFLIPAKQELDTQISFMKQGDIILIASYSGDIKDYVESIHTLKLLDIPIISITNFNKNDLSTFTPYNLYYQSTSLTPNLKPKRISYPTLNIVQDILYREYVRFGLENKETTG